MKAIYWVITVVVVSVGVFIYLVLGDSQQTVPKIKLSYFTDETEIATSVTKILSQDLQKAHFFWMGIEPEKTEQFAVIVSLKQQLEKTKNFKHIILDEELKFSKEWQDLLHVTEVVKLKESLNSTGEMLSAHEKKGQDYIFITANIYSTPLIKENQLNQIKKQYHIQPTTFSLAYFPVDAPDEKNMLFPCSAEDHSGASAWSCLVSNRSRFSRRKIDFKNTKNWLGLMDLIGENDYMILLKKK